MEPQATTEPGSGSVFSRVVRRLRSTRIGRTDDALASLDADLDASDIGKLRVKIDEAVGETTPSQTARARAAEIGGAYLGLSPEGRSKFFDLLAAEYGPDEASIRQAMQARATTDDPYEKSQASARLVGVLQPPRISLFRLFGGLDHGVKFLVDVRSDLRRIGFLGDSGSGRRALDLELRNLLASWFDIGLLNLQRVTWSTPAAILERLIEYEAVHDIASWDDLKRRLAPDRRLYAFFHPGMPGEPLIFVEVALTVGLVDAIEGLIQPNVSEEDPSKADTATFYSISNCQPGLSGVPLGDFLIKRVVRELNRELPNIEVFGTLSPMPGFRTWVETHSERSWLEQERAVVAAVLADPQWWHDADLVARAQTVLPRLAADYLVNAKDEDRPSDPVARFHLANGARLERLLFLGNPTQIGQDRSLGMMVNYRYEPRHLDTNQDAYMNRREVVVSSTIRQLLAPA